MLQSQLLNCLPGKVTNKVVIGGFSGKELIGLALTTVRLQAHCTNKCNLYDYPCNSLLDH